MDAAWSRYAAEIISVTAAGSAPPVRLAVVVVIGPHLCDALVSPHWHRPTAV
jgi:hypothetical protein